MEFGVCFKGELSPQRLRRLVQQLEAGGFDYCWFYDSHILWRDCYVAMAMCIEHTSRIRFGPCVTNPGVREWSVAASLFAALALQSEGRFDIGLGRGDSSLRVMGKGPANLRSMVEFGQQVKAMVRGEEVTYPDCPSSVKFPWAAGHDLPLWIAAYGPKALKSAGEFGDGLILQIAEPEICRWLATQALPGRTSVRARYVQLSRDGGGSCFCRAYGCVYREDTVVSGDGGKSHRRNCRALWR